jgi:polyferredoxin
MNTEMGYVRKLRYAVQIGFLILTVFIGYRFYHFVLHFEKAGRPFVERPSSVDGFLPIAGLMSLKYFLFTGIIEPVHPAAFIIFVAVIAVSFFLKKGFCGWICPVGTVSQGFWMAGERLFGRNFRIEKYTDISLRSIKYLLMGLFIVLIGVAMAPNMMVLFFLTDYYKTADVRTMQFFTEMSGTVFWILIGIGGLSLAFKNAWCRYFCPYGALLGLLSMLSPVRISRNEEKCGHCNSCSRNCPSLIDVEKQESITSPECFGCLTCVSHCPSSGALNVTFKTGRQKRRSFQPYLYPLILIVFFYLIIGAGMITGNWHSQMPYDEYKRIMPGLSQSDTQAQ